MWCAWQEGVGTITERTSSVGHEAHRIPEGFAGSAQAFAFSRRGKTRSEMYSGQLTLDGVDPLTIMTSDEWSGRVYRK